MRYGQEKFQFCLFSKFGVLMLMSNVYLLIGLDPNLINTTSLVVQKKPNYYFYNSIETKCLFLKVAFSIKRIFFPRRTVGVEYSSKKFKKRRRLFSSSQEDNQLDLRRVVESSHVEPEVCRSKRTRHKPDIYGV